jgi:hypothetical protein
MRKLNDFKKIRKSNLLKFLIGLILIGSVNGFLSCSQKSSSNQSNKQRIGKLEKEIDSLIKIGRIENVRPLALELNKLKQDLLISDPFWEGRPYEKIVDELAKQYNLIESEDFEPVSTDTYKTILQIFPYVSDPNNPRPVEWNMEDANKIKKIIMKTLAFEPEIDEYSSMAWTASKYDIEICKTGSGDIRIEFLTKQE